MPVMPSAPVSAPRPAASPAAPAAVAATAPPVVPDRPGLEGALRAVMGRVARVMDVHNTDAGALHDQGRWGAAQQAAENAIAQLEAEGLLGDMDSTELAGIAVREIVGLGALEGLLSDDSVREIIVEGPRRICADFGRGLERAPGVFSSADAVVTVARRLLAQGGGAFAANRHIQHGTLPYGPHVTVILPPVAVRGPIIEIRRMTGGLDAAALVSRGVLNDEILDVVRDALTAHRNIAVLGPVGAGVTTVLGAIAGLAGADGARIVTAEDTPDLAIASDNVISLGTGGADSGVRLRDVVRQAGSLRADHLVVDDVRGADALDVFSELAARPGGDFVGVHGHGQAAEALMGMARLGSKAADAALAALVARAVQVVLEVARDEEGGHRVVRVTEITGANGKGLSTQDLFVYDGEFQSTGAAASFRA
jgi:pilus assembly protein CpaF